MNYRIGLEDLAANALIEIAPQGRRFVSYGDLELYGDKVVDVLSTGQERAALCLSRNKTRAVLQEHSDFFEEAEAGGKRGIRLVDGKTAEDLIERFQGYLPLDLLLALNNPRSIYVLKTKPGKMKQDKEANKNG